MSYFARQVDHGDGGGIVRLVDVVQVPSSVPDAQAWLAVMFKHNIAAWQAAGQWFVPCDGSAVNGATCQLGADLTNTTNFKNPILSSSLSPVSILDPILTAIADLQTTVASLQATVVAISTNVAAIQTAIVATPVSPAQPAQT